LQQNKDISFKVQIQPGEAEGLESIHTGGRGRPGRIIQVLRLKGKRKRKKRYRPRKRERESLYVQALHGQLGIYFDLVALIFIFTPVINDFNHEQIHYRRLRRSLRYHQIRGNQHCHRPLRLFHRHLLSATSAGGN
jgi:hypothetical protein